MTDKLANPVKKPSGKRLVLTNSLWLLIEKIIVMGGGLGLSILFARMLGPDDFGRYNYVLSFVALFSPVFALGMSNVLLRAFAKTPQNIPDIIRTCFTGRLLSGVVITAVTAIVLLLVVAGDSWKFQPLLLLLIINISNAFEVYGRWFQHQSDNKTVVLWRVAGFVFFAVVKVFAVFNYPSVVLLVSIVAAELLIKNLGYGWLYRRFAQPQSTGKFDRVIFNDIFAQSKFLIFSSLASVVYLKIDILMLESMRSAQEVGVYAVAARLSEVWYVLPRVLLMALFPQLLKIAQKSQQRYHRVLQRGFDLLFMSALALSGVVYWLAPWVIETLYGERYSEAVGVLQLHIFASLFIYMRVLFSQWLISESFAQFSLISQVFGAVVNVLLNLLLIPTYGAWGAAVATLISYSVTSYFCLFISSRTRVIAIMMTKAILFPFRLKEVLKRTLP